MFKAKLVYGILLLGLVVTAPHAAENVPRFRGDNGQGIYLNETAPVKWDDSGVKWRLKLPGQGHASPVKWGKLVFTAVADGEKSTHIVIAADAETGEIAWQKSFKFTPYKYQRKESSFATPTPAVDENHVYSLYTSTDKTVVVALDHSGNQVWLTEMEGIVTRHGFGTSPILVDDLVIFTHEQESVKDSPFKSSWVALKKSTGKIAWEIERETTQRNSFSTPITVDLGGKRAVLFTSESSGFTAVDPAGGNIIWSFNPFDMRTIGSATIAGNMLLGACKGKLVAVGPIGPEAPKQLYELSARYSPYCPTPLFKDGLLYNFTDNGYISVHHAENGELIWREKPASQFFSSPIWVDGKIYGTTIEGEVVVIEEGPRYKLLAINELGEQTRATPIVSNGRLYLRTYSQLICVGE